MPDDSIWQQEARAKNLPPEFVERLAESDGVSEEEKARLVRSVASTAELKTKREAAVEHGRRLGESEAFSRRETGRDRDQRIRRAMAYAAWEFDGKPQSSESQRLEFGVEKTTVPGFLEREKTWRKRGEQ